MRLLHLYASVTERVYGREMINSAAASFLYTFQLYL